MRVAVLVAWLVVARVVGATCLDDCKALYGGSGDDYQSCVADCGVCGNGEVEGDEDCDDGNTVGGDCCDAACHFEAQGSPCVDDTGGDLCATCDGEGDCSSDDQPASSCAEPTAAGKSSLLMNDSNDDTKDLLLWKWRGAPEGRGDFGDPVNATTYGLCIYDASGLLSSITTATPDDCGRHSCWADQRSGFRYRSADHSPDGAARVLLQQGRRSGRTKLFFKAEGDNLDLPALDGLDTSVTVQLRRGDSITCWSATYGISVASRHDALRFKHRSEPPTTSTSTTTTTTTSTSTTSSEPGATTSTTLMGFGATVQVSVVDDSGAPVDGADVTITYAGGQDGPDDFTDETGTVVFTDQQTGVAAVITVEDDSSRHGDATVAAGFAAGTNPVTITVR